MRQISLPWQIYWRRMPIWRPIRIGVVSTISLLVLILVVNSYVALATSRQRYDTVDSVPAEHVAIVFGAGVRPDGRLSRFLADRVDAAVELYHAGRIRKLLMTGDNSSVYYDEVSAMRHYAIERGVAAEDITLDYAGFRTYDSCYRAQEIFGVSRAIVITQRYHLPRAVYTCRQLGVDVVGFGTPDWQVYRSSVMFQYTLREMLATLNAVWEVHFSHPLPRFLGPFEGID